MDLRHQIHPALRGLVDRIEGYEFRLDPRAVHHGVPSPTATVIISFDEPLDVQWLDGLRHPRADGSLRVRHWLHASGLHTEPALIHTHGVQHGIQLNLTPAGCRALLGTPMGPLHLALVDHADLPLGVPDPLHARLAEAGWSERFRLLDDHLIRTAGRCDTWPPNDLAHAWRLFGERRGKVGVSELADELGWSRRHLVKRFTAEFGLPPRDIGRLHRFGVAQHYAKTGASWTTVAAYAGYADQAHLTREFRSLVGRTPTDWRAELFPIPSSSS